MVDQTKGFPLRFAARLQCSATPMALLLRILSRVIESAESASQKAMVGLQMMSKLFMRAYISQTARIGGIVALSVVFIFAIAALLIGQLWDT